MYKNGVFIIFIPMVLFLWLKIAKNCQKWVYMGICEIFKKFI